MTEYFVTATVEIKLRGIRSASCTMTVVDKIEAPSHGDAAIAMGNRIRNAEISRDIVDIGTSTEENVIVKLLLMGE